MTCTDGIDNDCDGLVDTDDETCEKAEADVFLKKLKAPESIKIKKGKKKISVKATDGQSDPLFMEWEITVEELPKVDLVFIN